MCSVRVRLFCIIDSREHLGRGAHTCAIAYDGKKGGYVYAFGSGAQVCGPPATNLGALTPAVCRHRRLKDQ